MDGDRRRKVYVSSKLTFQEERILQLVYPEVKIVFTRAFARGDAFKAAEADVSKVAAVVCALAKTPLRYRIEDKLTEVEKQKIVDAFPELVFDFVGSRVTERAYWYVSQRVEYFFGQLDIYSIDAIAKKQAEDDCKLVEENAAVAAVGKDAPVEAVGQVEVLQADVRKDSQAVADLTDFEVIMQVFGKPKSKPQVVLDGGQGVINEPPFRGDVAAGFTIGLHDYGDDVVGNGRAVIGFEGFATVTGFDPYGRTDYCPPEAGIVRLMAVGGDLVVGYVYEGKPGYAVKIGAVGRFGERGSLEVDLVLDQFGERTVWRSCQLEDFPFEFLDKPEVLPEELHDQPVELLPESSDGAQVSSKVFDVCFDVVAGNAADVAGSHGSVAQAPGFSFFCKEWEPDGLLLYSMQSCGQDLLVFCGRQDRVYQFTVCGFFVDASWQGLDRRKVQLSVQGWSVRCRVLDVLGDPDPPDDDDEEGLDDYIKSLYPVGMVD